MKIRIKGNSIRYRLTRSEVETFGLNSYIEETTDFNGNQFKYALQAKEGVDTLDVQFENNTITLFLNKEKSKNWFNINQVGFSQDIQRTNGNVLSLLLEKDFACVDERGEDESDNYPNPKMNLH